MNCYDPPALLYYRGNVDFNAAKIIAIVGTRSKTVCGKQRTEQLIADLEEQKIVVVSGLALGVDAIAHKVSLKHQLRTVAVLAHGLDKFILRNTQISQKKL